MKETLMFSKTSRALVMLATALTITACAGPGHRGAFERQLSSQSTAPILSVQGYVIQDAEDGRRLRETWHEMAGLMKAKPGFIAADLNPGAAGSDLWIEISKWESVAHLRAAFDDPKVQQTAAKLPRIRMNHLFVASGGGHVTGESSGR